MRRSKARLDRLDRFLVRLNINPDNYSRHLSGASLNQSLVKQQMLYYKDKA